MTSPNVTYPGRPDYEGPRDGCLLAADDDLLGEYTYDCLERVRLIRVSKPAHEQGLRLHHLVMLPEERIPQPELWKEVVRAWQAYLQFIVQGWQTYVQTQWAWYVAAKPELLALLTEYVPDHTWNGEWFVYPDSEDAA